MLFINMQIFANKCSYMHYMQHNMLIFAKFMQKYAIKNMKTNMQKYAKNMQKYALTQQIWIL